MRITTAGEVLNVSSDLAWATRLITRAVGADDDLSGAADHADPATVCLTVESSTRFFDGAGLRPVTRGVFSDGRTTVMSNVGGSGFDLRIRAEQEVLEVTARYRPPHVVRAVNLLCPGRFGLLAGQVLVHYPVLWRAGWRGRVPLHVAVVCSPDGTPMLAGPGGVGKSTLLTRVLGGRVRALADNLCVADQRDCFGLAEPIRSDRGAPGQPRPPGRARISYPNRHRVPAATPNRVVVLERGPHTRVEPVSPEAAARTLVAGTYTAGELRRYWAFASTLALATGRGPAHPPIEAVARAYAERLPRIRVVVGDGDTVGLGHLCQEVIAA